ncbi:MAG: TldD/PmbA family protein [Bacilli bacterium]|nr:TldD/PmbA family protein [Bacilli bacterium]
MKYDKLFSLAKERGIDQIELAVSTSKDLSFSLFHGEVDSYNSSNSSSYMIRGIYNGKLGSVSSDVYSNDLVEYFINEIINNAKFIENDDPVFIYKGSEKYKKINTYNKDLEKISVDEKLAKLHELEDKIKAIDSRIVEIESVEYSESVSSETIINSNGLKLSQKNNYFFIYGAALAKEGEQTKSGGDYRLGNDFSKLNIDELAKDIADDTLNQLGGEPCQSGAYKAVLGPQVVKALLNAYISSAIAEDVQKNSSLFVGKLGQKVASRHITVEDKPLARTIFARYFDDEGVATYNKAIIKNGVLQTYLYNLTTAAKDGVESTGNAQGAGSKVYTGTWYTEMKPGKKSQEELFKEVGEGVYITEVQGLHAGLNPRSGNFSLQSTGFLIKDGKKDRPLDIITVSGNLVSLFNDVTAVGNDSRESIGGKFPSVIVKKINVGGK